MCPVKSEYKSELGWSIALPGGWEPLDTEGGDELVAAPPVAFACKDDWSLTFTWMIQSQPLDQDTIMHFQNLVIMPGAVSIDEAATVVQGVSSTAGEVDNAEAIELADGTIALEVEERLTSEDAGQGMDSRRAAGSNQGAGSTGGAGSRRAAASTGEAPSAQRGHSGASKLGYQLIYPLFLQPGQLTQLQRLCFYAPADAYEKHIGEVRKAARSFHYNRPFGLES